MLKKKRRYAAKMRKRKQRSKEKATGSKVDRKKTKKRLRKLVVMLLGSIILQRLQEVYGNHLENEERKLLIL